MKLFIWDNPYSIPFGGTLFFAIAETVEEARKIAETAPGYYFGNENDPQRPKLGEPSRVRDLPCGEFHSWSE